MNLQATRQKAGVQKSTWLDSGLLAAGMILLVVGVVAPLFLTVETFRIYDTLYMAIDQDEKIYVLLAALKLVLLNTVRAVPHYLGAFFLAGAINDLADVKGRSLLSALAVCITIPAVYFIIESLYHIRYDFGVPALSMISMLLIFSKIRFDFINIAKKVLLLVLMIFSLQFLDVVPALQGLPIGRGESSYDIKLISSFLGANTYLQGMAVTLSLLFLFVAMLMLMLIHDENNIKSISEVKEQHEQDLMETRMRILENRTYMELNHLVHDLKSPLTSMQTLVGVVKMSCEDRGQDRDADCLRKVEGNIERMSGMISEILYEDRLQVVKVREIINGLLAQISTTEYVDLVHVNNLAPEERIAVNRIRFSRALVNLIENSFYAVDKNIGEIWLQIGVDKLDGLPAVSFEVRDNGIGIDQEFLGRVWAKGFSTRNSHGLGLSFVRKAVEQCEGTISIESVQKQGTQVKILLPIYEEKRQEQHTGSAQPDEKGECLMECTSWKAMEGFQVEGMITCCGLPVKPGEDGQALAGQPEGMDRQQFERQYNILMGYACMALGRMPKTGEKVNLAHMELPGQEGRDALAAVWFYRACQTQEPDRVVMAVYNGLGALPGGFEEVRGRVSRHLGPKGAEQFFKQVQAARQEENDLGGRSPEPVGQAFWAQVNPDGLRDILKKEYGTCR